MKKEESLLPSFAGIALADILANSVAMIIILIVITIALKHQQEQERLAEFKEVSVLLSRDVASSVVMNGLPSSGPARLHDYKNSPLDRILDPNIMPIVELHRDFARDYYTGTRYVREELLLQDNTFDHFISAMTPSQGRLIRVDIYDVRLFYIVMSILRKHGIFPAHWHFLPPPKGVLPDGPEPVHKKSPEREPGEAEQLALEGTGENRRDSRNQVWESFPDAVQLGEYDAEEHYPFDDLAYDSETPRAFDGGEQNGETPEARSSEQMFNALTEMLARSLSGVMQDGGLPKIVRFRTAKPSSARKMSDLERLLELEKAGDGPAVSYTKLLIALFDFMRRADLAAQAGDYSVLERFEFERDIIMRALGAELPANPKQAAFFIKLAEWLAHTSEEAQALEVSQETSSELGHNALRVAINTPLKEAVLVSTPSQEKLDFLPGEADLRLRLGLYPAIYKGLLTPLDRSRMMLMPTEATDPGKDRWRVVSLIDPKQGDYLLAFVYGRLAEGAGGNKEFVIASDENGIQLNQFHTFTVYPPVSFRKEREAFIAVGAAALILLAGVMRRFRRTGR